MLGADSQRSATNQNRDNVNATNALNLQMFQEGRGSTGSAIFPIYGKAAESQLYNDTLNTYDATGAIQPTAQQLQAIVAGQQQNQDLANTAAAGIFNGATQTQELQNQQPVYQANLAAAQTQKQGTLEALQSTLNNIKAIQAGKGYAGDSFGNSLLNFQARQGANTNIANQFSQANIGNAQAIQGIRQNAINRQLQNLNLPTAMAQNNINLAQQPANALAQQQGQRQQLFNMFRIGPGQFTYQNLPLVQPNSAAYGALANIGAAGNDLASAYIKNPNGVRNLFGLGGTTSSQGSSVDPNSLAAFGSSPGFGISAGGNSLPIGDYSTAAQADSLAGSFG